MVQLIGPRHLMAVILVLAVVMLSLPRSHAAETAGISGLVVSAEDPLSGTRTSNRPRGGFEEWLT